MFTEQIMGLVKNKDQGRDFLIDRFCQISESWCLAHCHIGGLRNDKDIQFGNLIRRLFLFS